MLKALLAGAACLVATAASAANPDFCANYAQAALNQARVAHTNPACAPGAIGTRWSNEYGVHYGWCITAAPQAAAGERGERTRYLRSCRGF